MNSTSVIKVRTVLDGIVKVPSTINNINIQTIRDLKNGICHLRGWESSTQHLYQNGLELKDDQILSETLIAKCLVLLIPINHQQRRYKSKSEIESEAHVQPPTVTPSSPTGSAAAQGGSVSDQLAQIMEEFASTHPGGSGTTGTTATTHTPAAQQQPQSTTQQNTTRPTGTTLPPTSPTSQTQPRTTPSISDYQRQLLIDNIPVDESLVAVVMELGFSKRIAKKSLILHNMDPEAAVEWIFTNTDNPYILESEFTAEELIQLAQKYQNAMRDE